MATTCSLEGLLTKALKKAAGRVPADLPLFVEPSERSAHGDYATNAAFVLAATRKHSPLDVARELRDQLVRDAQLRKIVERVEVAAPGFLNFSLSPAWLQQQAMQIAQDERYGFFLKGRGRKKRVQVEFISANPTGPLTLANGRGGFLGDCLANVLDAAGYDVTREYYVNDAGEQVRKLGWSVLAAAGYRTPQEAMELYRAPYVEELAAELKLPVPHRGYAEANEKLAEHVAGQASKAVLKEIKRVARKAGIRFDVWFSEKSLYRQHFTDEILKMLRRKRLVEEREGAVWLKLSALNDARSQDKVIVKRTGEPTYVLPDLAYHYEKFNRRKFERVIDIFGADHHGHAKVLTQGLRALGLPAPDIILIQLVRLVEGGREVKMSKRAGAFVTLEELLDDVGVDVARWFFIERAPETHMEFNLTLATERSEKNPVFYAQYAHVRCSAILRKAPRAEPRGSGRSRGRRGTTQKLDALTHPAELALMKELVKLPDLVLRIAQSYEVHHLPTYATSLAQAFSVFYRDCPVLDAEPDVRAARLTLVRATQVVLANTLGLMGIRAPEKM